MLRFCVECFDAVSWASRMASGLQFFLAAHTGASASAFGRHCIKKYFIYLLTKNPAAKNTKSGPGLI